MEIFTQFFYFIISLPQVYKNKSQEQSNFEGVKYLLSLENIKESLNAVESERRGQTPLFCAIEAGAIGRPFF